MNTHHTWLTRWIIGATLLLTGNIGLASTVNFTFQVVDPQTLQVNFSNNSYVTQDRAEEIAFNRIAKLSLKQGFNYFELINPVYSQQFVSNRKANTEATATKTSWGNPGNIYQRQKPQQVQITFPRYNFTTMVKLHKSPKTGMGGKVYSAKNVIMRVTKIEKTFNKVKLHQQQQMVQQGGEATQTMKEDASGNVVVNQLSEKAVKWTDLSHQHLVDKNWVEAIRTASAAINVAPDFDVPYLNRATAYIQHGYLNKAVQDVDHALALNPNNTLAINLKGYTMAQAGNNSEAIGYYEKACHMKLEMACMNFKEVIGYRPDDINDRAKFYLGLAQEALNKNRWDEAINHASHVLTLDPQSVEAFTLRGAAYSELKNMDAALQDINQAITLNPDFAAAYHSRGRIYELMGSTTDAAIEFEIACTMGVKASCNEHARLNPVVKR